MTAQFATAGEVMTRQDAPSAPVLYPTGPGPAAVCDHCFWPPAVTWASKYGRTCAGCHTALAAGRPVTLPDRGELPELLLRWARWDINEEVGDDQVAAMLAALLPGLDAQDADGCLGELEDALLWQQDVTSPGFDWLLVEPEARDPELVEQRAAARVDEAVQALIGGAR